MSETIHEADANEDLSKIMAGSETNANMFETPDATHLAPSSFEPVQIWSIGGPAVREFLRVIFIWERRSGPHIRLSQHG